MKMIALIKRVVSGRRDTFGELRLAVGCNSPKVILFPAAKFQITIHCCAAPLGMSLP